jgi:hypothetical protein
MENYSAGDMFIEINKEVHDKVHLKKDPEKFIDDLLKSFSVCLEQALDDIVRRTDKERDRKHKENLEIFKMEKNGTNPIKKKDYEEIFSFHNDNKKE